MGDFSDLFGDAAGAHDAVARLGEAALHRINRRAERIAEREGRSHGGVSLAEVASGIAMALRRGDQPGAQQLVEAGAALFGAGPLVAQVGIAAHDLELDSLRGMTHGD